MAQHIVDASIAIQTAIDDTHSVNATALFSAVYAQDRIYAPDFCRIECVNVLWKQVRFKNLDQQLAEKLVDDLTGLRLSVLPVNDMFTSALQISIRHQLAIYDSIYIALAQRLQYPLITDDAKQHVAAASEGVTLKAITDFAP